MVSEHPAIEHADIISILEAQRLDIPTNGTRLHELQKMLVCARTKVVQFSKDSVVLALKTNEPNIRVVFNVNRAVP